MDELIAQLRAAPADLELRLVVADALEQAGQTAIADFVRMRIAIAHLSPDHAGRFHAEAELSWLRRQVPAEWRELLEPKVEREGLLTCDCYSGRQQLAPGLRLHGSPQDTECEAWKRICTEVEEAAADGRETFVPGRSLTTRAQHQQIVSLPPTLRKLTRVRHLEIHGLALERLPAEVGDMASLESFDLYMSYAIHWLPYELMHCPIRQTKISTRAAYGNRDAPTLFPPLAPDPLPPAGVPRFPTLRPCSVCRQPFEDRQEHRSWRQHRWRIDDLALLVNACSAACSEAARGQKLTL